MKLFPIVLIGPTASGKSSVAIELSKILPAEIISADSMQIYRGLDIGTAKPSTYELKKTKHYFIDIIDFSEEYSVVDYQKQAYKIIGEVISKNKYPIICGGTGLYINSLIYNLDFSNNDKNEKLRNYLYDLADKKGKQYVHDILARGNLERAKKIHPNNLKRVIRSIENLKSNKMNNTFSKNKETKYNYKIFGLQMNRKVLYERINQRVDKMIDNGLFEETKNLIEQNITQYKTPMQAIGYKEIIKYYKNEISREEAIDLLKKNTRNYAKRQITWFKKIKETQWINTEQFDSNKEIARQIIKFL